MTSSAGRAVFSKAFCKAQQKALEAKRVELWRKAGVSAIRTAAEARGTPVTEDMERAVADGDQELAVSLLNGNVAAYQAVTAALRRTRDGSYGLCERCGDPIPEARLKAIPEVCCCVTCQGQEEMATGSVPQRRRFRH